MDGGDQGPWDWRRLRTMRLEVARARDHEEMKLEVEGTRDHVKADGDWAPRGWTLEGLEIMRL